MSAINSPLTREPLELEPRAVSASVKEEYGRQTHGDGQCAGPQAVQPLRGLSLFAGIGAFDLGLERAGLETAAFCEINADARRELARHWPEIPCFEDVCTLSAAVLRDHGVTVNAIWGGFPCQDVSISNVHGQGLDGDRSGLWFHYARLIGELRPEFVIVENVAALLSRGLDRVLGSLAALGYDAEWEVVSAADVGAPHDRERLWLVAYPAAAGRAGVLRHWPWLDAQTRPEWPTTPLDTQRRAAAWLARTAESLSPVLGDDDGLTGRVAKRQLGQLGNAVIPQIPELIGRAILQARAA